MNTNIPACGEQAFNSYWATSMNPTGTYTDLFSDSTIAMCYLPKRNKLHNQQYAIPKKKCK